MTANQIGRHFTLFFLVIMLLAFFSAVVFNHRENTIILAAEIPSISVDTIKRFPQEISIITSHKLVVDKPDFWTNFLSPNDKFTSDPIRLLLVILLSIILLVTFSDFSYQKPFTKRTTIGMQMMLYTIIFFLVVYFLRDMWLTEKMQKITGEEFTFTGFNLVLWPEFWVGVVLIRVARVFKKGRRLQEEQDLTV